MNSISNLCEEIVARHAQLGRAMVSLLRPGLSADEQRERLREARIVLPRSAMELFCWRDGIARKSCDGGRHFFPDCDFKELAQCLLTYGTQRVIRRTEWPRWLFPVFRCDSMDIYAIECASVITDDAPIWYFDNIQACVPAPAFDSLARMLETLVVCFDRKIFFLGDERYLDLDDRAFWQLAGEMNPTCRAFWEQFES
jgi:hypothetical protein